MLRSAIARTGQLAAARVGIEGVQRLPRKDSTLGIVVRLSADVGTDVLAADTISKSLKVKCTTDYTGSC